MNLSHVSTSKSVSVNHNLISWCCGSWKHNVITVKKTCHKLVKAKGILQLLYSRNHRMVISKSVVLQWRKILFHIFSWLEFFFWCWLLCCVCAIQKNLRYRVQAGPFLSGMKRKRWSESCLLDVEDLVKSLSSAEFIYRRFFGVSCSTQNRLAIEQGDQKSLQILTFGLHSHPMLNN